MTTLSLFFLDNTNITHPLTEVAKQNGFGSLTLVDKQGRFTEEVIDFKEYKGKVVLIVNTASYCGFTNQYDDLQKLWVYKKHLIRND